MQRTSTKGFTVPELLVAIVVSTIVLVGIMVILVNLSRTGTSNIAASNQIRKSQSAMATIKQDLTSSTKFLIAPTITDADIAASPSGAWTHIGGGAANRTLILQQPATDKPYQDSTRSLVYLTSGGCPIGHTPVYTNVIYYLKDSTLYRRSLIPAPVVGDPYCNGVTTPSQIQTCTTPGTPTICTEKDTIIAEDITGLDISYYTNPSDANPAVNGLGVEIAYDTVTPIDQISMNNLASIRITLTNEANIDGKMKEYSSSLRLMRANF
jgi:prepilin-type N-terminal cleavage/methylation domain-containing protein